MKTTSNKYIDLKDMIHAETRDLVYLDEVGEVLEWLDAHPDQVPGRTITESELIAAVDETNHEDMNEYQKAHALLVHLGHTIPAPEPTNADRIIDLMGKAPANLNRRDLAAWLDAHGVVASGGETDD